MCKVLKKLSSVCNQLLQNSIQWTSKCDSQHSFYCQCDDEIACLVLRYMCRLFASNCVHSFHLEALNGSKVNCKCHFDGGRLWLHGCSDINTSLDKLDISIVSYHFATYYFRFDTRFFSFRLAVANDFHLTFAPIRSNGSWHFHSCLTVSACLMRIWWFWRRVMQQWRNIVRFSRQTKWWYV